MWNDFYACDKFYFIGSLEAITIPVHIIVGDKEQMMSLMYAIFWIITYLKQS